MVSCSKSKQRLNSLVGQANLCLMQGYYRGARAALKLGNYEEALELCKRGIPIDTEASELQQLRQEAEKKAKVCRQLMR